MSAAAGQASLKAAIHCPKKPSLQPRFRNVTQQDIRNDKQRDMKKVAISRCVMGASLAPEQR